jgi:hypothetical protein
MAAARWQRRVLRLSLIVLAACGILVWLQPRDFGPAQWAMSYFGIAIGTVCAVNGLDRWLRPKPILELSPAGVRITHDTLKPFFIPWHEEGCRYHQRCRAMSRQRPNRVRRDGGAGHARPL